MPTPLAHLCDLALRSLDAHERRLGELRGRLAPTLAAGGLGVTLLSGPALDGASDPAARLVLAVAGGGLLVALAGTARLLTAKAPAIADVSETERELRTHDALRDVDTYHETMVATLGRRLTRAQADLRSLERVFTCIVCGTLVSLCGLSLAALVT